MSYPHQDLGYRVGGPSPYGEGPYKEKNLARSAMPNLFTYMGSPTREQEDTQILPMSADPSKVQQKAPQALCPPDVLIARSSTVGAGSLTNTSRILRPIASGSSGKRMPIASYDWIFIHGKSIK